MWNVSAARSHRHGDRSMVERSTYDSGLRSINPSPPNASMSLSISSTCSRLFAFIWSTTRTCFSRLSPFSFMNFDLSQSSRFSNGSSPIEGTSKIWNVISFQRGELGVFTIETVFWNWPRPPKSCPSLRHVQLFIQRENTQTFLPPHLEWRSWAALNG